ncbi:RidA family protein [Campylobacter concisus]|uniref:RidA family protein n=1 Tax=Campylobacter concisus TaxID=199 RepID=UPI000CD9B1A9|nr:RidA family protein [Campylobacter concisus]QPH88912.1 hypothetical protein CVT15_09515 [Campylobacter concisus]QPI03827.1 hypothetical protein G5B95_09295 [Campylobacter concisus]
MNVKFDMTPGYGEKQLKEFGYSQVAVIGDRIEISGQGGWDDRWNFPQNLKDEIEQAFKNVERTLAVVGASWNDVFSVHSYHVGFEPAVNGIMTKLFKKYMPTHAPLWTCLGVEKLGDPKMRVEIRVSAVAKKNSSHSDENLRSF